MKITRTIAENIASLATIPLKNELSAAKNAMYKWAYDIAKAEIPKEIMELYYQYPEYFQSQGWVSVSWKWNNVSVNINPLPKPKTIKCNELQEAEIVAFRENIKVLEQKHDALNNEIIQTLLTLGTYKNVLEQMPELAVHIQAPAAKNKSLAVSLEGLKQKLSEIQPLK